MKRVLAVSVAAAAAAVVVVMAGHAGPRPASAAQNILLGASPAVGIHEYLSRPERAPSELRAKFSAVRAALARREHGSGSGPRGRNGVFNDDTVGLPQNEESVNSCRGDRNVVLEGTNDYRFLLDPEGNSTGWHFSTDGGRTLANEGLLPALTGPDGSTLPSGGDPVDVAADGCDALYAGDLNYGITQPSPTPPSGVGIYRSTPRILATCPQGQSDGGMTHPECWPTEKLVDFAAPGHFLDKDWMDVGRSGSAGRVVWMTYDDVSDFDADGNEQSSVVKAVRCTADLSSCTQPIALSSGQTVAEYPWVTIGPDGRTYITWGEFFGGSFTGPSQQAWIAVAEPGSTTFRRYPIYREDQVMRGGGEHPHANDFRTGTMFKNTVTMYHGHPRVYVTWDRCRLHAQDQICEEPEIPLTYSDDLGKTWSPQRVVSAGGDNYFPFIDADPDTGALAEVYYTNRFDPVFHNRQDVELDHLSAGGAVTSRERITPFSNETEADPLLGGTFIGDYIEVDAKNGRDYTGYNANYRSVPFIHDGIPIPQQDNYLDVR